MDDYQRSQYCFGQSRFCVPVHCSKINIITFVLGWTRFWNLLVDYIENVTFQHVTMVFMKTDSTSVFFVTLQCWPLQYIWLSRHTVQIEHRFPFSQIFRNNRFINTSGILNESGRHTIIVCKKNQFANACFWESQTKNWYGTNHFDILVFFKKDLSVELLNPQSI